MEAKAGDRVEVHLAKSEYSGILLESPESGIVLVKLDTGYNIGLNKKDVLKIDVLEEGKEVEKDVELKNDKNKPNVKYQLEELDEKELGFMKALECLNIHERKLKLKGIKPLLVLLIFQIQLS